GALSFPKILKEGKKLIFLAKDLILRQVFYLNNILYNLSVLDIHLIHRVLEEVGKYNHYILYFP
ncbi:hypothetical protein, partial [Staphylococcus haemolyticus]|uniref:hypothetical protein n=1 Tax=Staphylococcus haemolyticus TaxID=1283 RepID=UPI001D147824